MNDLILQISATLAAITAICVFIAKTVKIIKNIVSFFKGLADRLNTIENHTRENYLTGLKLVIMSDEIPIEERLIAGEEYVSNGGNGQIKAKYHCLKKEYEEKELKK